MTEDNFQRSQLLLGTAIMQRVKETKVIIFGIGGVGSWCAESLVRSGIHYLTIVDSDTVAVSNVNRQLHAASNTIGLSKTEVLKKRLLEINPRAEITALQKEYSADNFEEFNLDGYDVITDAIDSLQHKLHLIRTATRTGARFYCSMGAAARLNPMSIKVAEFWDVKGCHFARHIRKVIRKGDLPAKEFSCVYSDELLPNLGAEDKFISQNHEAPAVDEYQDPDASKANINGSLVHMTAIFGFTLAGLIIGDIYKELT